MNKLCLMYRSIYLKHSRREAHIIIKNEGRGGGQVVSLLAFYSDDLSSNPAEANSFL